MLKLFYYHQKLCGNISSTLRVGCLTCGVDKTQKMTKISEKLEKVCKFFQKNAKIRNVEMLKQFYYHQKLCGNLSSTLREGCLTSRVDKTQKITKIFKKVEKICKFFQKKCKISQCWNVKTIFYHQKLCGNLSSNLRVGCLTSRVDETQKLAKIFKKLEKICKFSQKMQKFAMLKC